MLLFALQLLYGMAVRRYFDGLVAAVAPIAELRYSLIEAFPPGRLGMREVRFHVAGLPGLEVRAERALLRSQDHHWLLAWLLGQEPGLGRDFSLRLEGVTVSPELLAQLRQRLGPAGLTLPFEGVACSNGGRSLGNADYAALGWNHPRWDLDLNFGYRAGERRLDLDWRLDRAPPGALFGRAVLSDVPSSGALLRADLGGAHIDLISLSYQEQGLLAQRNGHCSNGDGNGSVFLERHRQQLHAWLGELGMVPDEPIWNAYGEWLQQGGELELVARPARGVSFDEYHRFAPEDRLRLLGLSLKVGELEPVPIEAVASGVLLEVDFSPLPDLPGEPVEYDQLAQGPDDTREHDDIAGDWDPLRGTEDPGFADHELEVEADQSVIDAEPAQSAPARPQLVFRPIEFTELAERRGQRVRITTVGGNRHSGIVLDATDDAMELQISRYGGGARLPIGRDSIHLIELVRVE